MKCRGCQKECTPEDKPANPKDAAVFGWWCGACLKANQTPRFGGASR